MSVGEGKSGAAGGGSVGRRRRRWSEARKRQIVAETLEPGVSVPMVAQRYNLKGSFFMARTVAPTMKAKGAGKIVNITSTLGVVGSSAGAAYCASKGGQMLLTKALCLELGPHGINVNAVAPGATETDMNAAIRAQPGRIERMDALSPIGRYWAQADDMSGAVAYLVSDDAKAVHGAHIMIDHGWTAW